MTKRRPLAIAEVISSADGSDRIFTTVLYRTKWCVIALMTIFIVSFGTFLDDDEFVSIPTVLKGPGDHYLHFASFLLLSFLALLGEPQWKAVVMGVALLAGMLEIVQIFLQFRGANFTDFGFSLLGLWAGCIAAFLVNTTLRQRCLKAGKIN